MGNLFIDRTLFLRIVRGIVLKGAPLEVLGSEPMERGDDARLVEVRHGANPRTPPRFGQPRGRTWDFAAAGAARDADHADQGDGNISEYMLGVYGPSLQSFAAGGADEIFAANFQY